MVSVSIAHFIIGARYLSSLLSPSSCSIDTLVGLRRDWSWATNAKWIHSVSTTSSATVVDCRHSKRANAQHVHTTVVTKVVTTVPRLAPTSSAGVGMLRRCFLAQ